jgi:crossover junction endodeoxyribonuclease RuvC
MRDYILSIDGATEWAGYCIMDYEYNIIDSGVIHVKGKPEERIIDVTNRYRELIAKYKVKEIVIEDRYEKYKAASHALSKLQGSLVYMIHSVFRMSPNYLLPTEVRKHLLGQGKGKKEEIANYLIKFYKNIDLVKLIGPFSDEKKDNVKTDDIYDAIAIGVAFLRQKISKLSTDNKKPKKKKTAKQKKHNGGGQTLAEHYKVVDGKFVKLTRKEREEIKRSKKNE